MGGQNPAVDLRPPTGPRSGGSIGEGLADGGRRSVDQMADRHVANLRQLRFRKSQLGEDRCAYPDGGFRGGEFQKGAALDRGLVEQTLGFRQGHQGGYLASAAVHVHHDRPLARNQTRGPDVDTQAVLASRLPIGAVEQERIFVAVRLVIARSAPTVGRGTYVPKVHGTANASPRIGFDSAL